MNVLFTLGRWTWTLRIQCLFEQLWHGTDLHHWGWPREAESPLMVVVIPTPVNFHPPTLIKGVPWGKDITGADQQTANSCAGRNIDHSIKCSIICSCTIISITEWTLVILSAAAKSRQSCPTLCDPIHGSPPDSFIPGILQTRTLEWVVISFTNAWKWKMKVMLPSPVTLSDPMDCSLPGSSVQEILQARVLEWVTSDMSSRVMCILACISPLPFGTSFVFYLMVLNWYPWAVSQQQWKARLGSLK